MSGFDPTQEVRELRWRIKQLNKQVGKQGETIHSLRADLAEVRELNSRAERGQIRALDRQVAALQDANRILLDMVSEMRAKIDEYRNSFVAGVDSGI